MRNIVKLAVGAAVAALAFAEAFPSSIAPPAIETDTPLEWRWRLGEVDRALAADDIRTALAAWHDARRVALRSVDWRAGAAVAEAYLRIGDAVDLRRAFVAEARDTYLEALERARRAVSSEGAFRIALALVALDQRDAVERAIQVACEITAAYRIAPGVSGRRACDGHPDASGRPPHTDTERGAS